MCKTLIIMFMSKLLTGPFLGFCLQMKEYMIKDVTRTSQIPPEMLDTKEDWSKILTKKNAKKTEVPTW